MAGLAGRRSASSSSAHPGVLGSVKPGIGCAGVEPLGTDEITLADLELYQRFDADWVSFEDDTSTTPPAADMVS